MQNNDSRQYFEHSSKNSVRLTIDTRYICYEAYDVLVWKAKLTHRPEDGGSRHHRNVGKFLRDYTKQHPRRKTSSSDISEIINIALLLVQIATQRTEIHTTEFKPCVCAWAGARACMCAPERAINFSHPKIWFFAFHSKSAATELIHIAVLSATQALRPVAYTSGIQPGLRVPPGVRKDILGGT
jgi:hypothetical protein